MMMNVLTLVILPLACIMPWLFLFHLCVPTHVFFLLLFFFSLSLSHTGTSDAVLTECRQLVAVAHGILEKCKSTKCDEFRRFKGWLIEIMYAEISRFPESRARKESLIHCPLTRLFRDRNDSSYAWSGTPAAEAEYVTAMLAEFDEWKKPSSSNNSSSSDSGAGVAEGA
jgi:hypothetical protein